MTKMWAGAVVLALAAAGCGGSSDDNAPSKAEFARKANAICAKGNRTIDAAAKRTFTTKATPPVSKQIAFVKKDALPSVEKQVSDIRALTPPKGDEDRVNAILDAADQAIAKTRKDPLLATQEGKKDPFAPANKLARQYGLKTCGS
jgi:hypothetical protein